MQPFCVRERVHFTILFVGPDSFWVILAVSCLLLLEVSRQLHVYGVRLQHRIQPPNLKDKGINFCTGHQL